MRVSGEVHGRTVGARDTAAPVRVVDLGLVCAPDIPEKIGHRLARELPSLLGRMVDDAVHWKISLVVDPLTGSDRDAPELLDACHQWALREGWDVAICLTDLPLYRGGHLVVADASLSRRVAGLSLPVLGATRLHPRAREAVVQLVHELYPALDGKTAETRREEDLPGPRPRHLVRRRLAELLAPFHRLHPPDEDMHRLGVDTRFVAPRMRGHLRLWAGMILANRPWKLFPSFHRSLAAAFATSAYVLVLPTIWSFAHHLGWVRLLGLMVVAVCAMVVWIIAAHHLWERPSSREDRHWSLLYNGVTVLTIAIAVLFSYTVLFVLVFLAAWVFVPEGYFRSMVGEPVGPADYATLAWMATSLATIAGALGVGLEDEETVLRATYGYRQRLRNRTGGYGGEP